MKCLPSTVAIHLMRAWEGIRTLDLRITNALLYRLSYPGAESQVSPSTLAGTDD